MSKTRPLTLIMLLAACSLSSCGRVTTHIRAYPIQNPQGIAFESDPSFVEAYNLHLSLRNKGKPKDFENTVVGLPNIHELQEIDPQYAGWNVDIIYPKKSSLMESIDNAKLSISDHIEPLIEKFDSAAGTDIKEIIVPKEHTQIHNADQEKVEQYPEGYKFDTAAGTNIKKIIVPKGRSQIHNVDQEKVEQYPQEYSKYSVECPEPNVAKAPEQNVAKGPDVAKGPEQNIAAEQTQYSPIDSAPADHTKMDDPRNTDIKPQCTEHLIYSTQPVISPPKKEKSRNKKKTENKEKIENKGATYDKPRVNKNKSNKNKSKIDQPKSTIQLESHPDKDRNKQVTPNSNEPNKISQSSSLNEGHDTDLLPQEMNKDLHPDESSKTDSDPAQSVSDNHFSKEYMEWYNSVHSGTNMDDIQEEELMQNTDHTNPEDKKSAPFTVENRDKDR